MLEMSFRGPKLQMQGCRSSMSCGLRTKAHVLRKHSDLLDWRIDIRMTVVKGEIYKVGRQLQGRESNYQAEELSLDSVSREPGTY